MIKGIIFDWIGTLYERNVGLFPCTEEILKKLKPKYKLGLVSVARGGIKNRKEEIEQSGVIHYFGSIIIDTIKTPEHYLNCMQKIGTTITTTVIVDDRMVKGIQIGNKLGCKTYWIQKGDYAHETPNNETGEPTKRINSIEELLEIL